MYKKLSIDIHTDNVFILHIAKQQAWSLHNYTYATKIEINWLLAHFWHVDQNINSKYLKKAKE